MGSSGEKRFMKLTVFCQIWGLGDLGYNRGDENSKETYPSGVLSKDLTSQEEGMVEDKR